jgi:hypothetical protein
VIEKDHNGWTNPATWNTWLHLKNDKETNRMMISLKITDAAQFENFCRYLWGAWSPDGHDLSEVNWQEIADSYCENE